MFKPANPPTPPPHLTTASATVQDRRTLQKSCVHLWREDAYHMGICNRIGSDTVGMNNCAKASHLQHVQWMSSIWPSISSVDEELRCSPKLFLCLLSLSNTQGGWPHQTSHDISCLNVKRANGSSFAPTWGYIRIEMLWRMTLKSSASWQDCAC